MEDTTQPSLLPVKLSSDFGTSSLRNNRLLQPANFGLLLASIFLWSVMSANIINVPDRALSWRWLDESDEKRLSFINDSKKPNAGTFVLSKEDHTLGNLIRLQLLRDSSVRFAGYRMPHPLIFDCHVRVETMDSKLTPTNVFDAALSDLQLETETLSRKWDVSKWLCCVSLGPQFNLSLPTHNGFSYLLFIHRLQLVSSKSIRDYQDDVAAYPFVHSPVDPSGTAG